MTVTAGSLCSGYLGLDESLRLALADPVELLWTVENDKNAAKVIEHLHPGLPNYGDLTTVEWDDVPRVDWLTMGFPCQDLSPAGKQAGMRPGTRSGLWFHCAYAISKLRPKWVLIENVRGILSVGASRDKGDDEVSGDVESRDADMGIGAVRPSRALGVVLGDLADLGFDAEWIGLRASDVGACHGRFRVFILGRNRDFTHTHTH